jgi:hypothetical protein
MPSSRLQPARSVAPTCISMTASCRAWSVAILSAIRPWARLSRSAARTRRSRSATEQWCRSPSPAANVFSASAAFFSGCERSNPNHAMAEKIWGDSPAGFFGYSHMLGGYSGGQAEYLRVPFADVGPIKVPKGLRDEQVLFLSDIFPTGYMAPDFCNIDGACGEGRDRSFVRHHPPCYAGGRS